MTVSLRSYRLLFSFLCVVVFGGAAVAQTVASPKLTRVRSGRDAEGLTARVAGVGLDLGRHESAVVDAEGNQLVWREVRRTTDRRGGIHIRYKQYLVGNGFEAELVGSGMATHWEANGALESVDGVQFEQVRLANRPAASRPAVGGGRIAAESAEPGANELMLIPDGGAFRFVYYKHEVAEHGGRERLVVDAGNAKVLRRDRTEPLGNCSSSGTPLVDALAYPVRP